MRFIRGFFVLLIALALYAQPSPTVIERVFINQLTPAASAPIRNIGQLGHTVFVTQLARPGLVCAGGVATPSNIGLEASFDDITYFRIGPTIPWVGELFGQNVITADGYYPYIRLNIRDMDAVNCQVSATYTGTMFSTTSNTTSAIGLEKTYRATVAAVGPTAITPALVGAQIVSVYEVVIWNPSAANTVTIGSTTGGVCTAGGATGPGFLITTLCQYCGFVFPYTGKVHFTSFEHVGADGGDLCLLLGNATATNVFVRYRYE